MKRETRCGAKARVPRPFAWRTAVAWLLLATASATPVRAAERPASGEPLRAMVISLAATADGGFWALLATGLRSDARLAVRFTAGGEVAEERFLRVSDGFGLGRRIAVDASGRVWIAVFDLDAAPEPRRPFSPDQHQPILEAPWLLRVYAPDGSVAAETRCEGDFLGLAPDGAAALVVEDVDDPPRVLRVDPFTGDREMVLRLPREEYGPPDGAPPGWSTVRFYPRLLRPAGGGAFYFVDWGSSVIVARRYAASGAPAGDWELGRPGGGQLPAATDGDDLFVATGSGVVRLRPHEGVVEWELEEPVLDLAAGAGGAWGLVDGGGRALRFPADGSAALSVDLDPPPPGMTYAERALLFERGGRAGDGATPEDLMALMLTAGGETAEAARESLLDHGTEAVGAILEAGDRWDWKPPFPELIGELLARHPAAGDRLLEHIEEAVAADVWAPALRLPSILLDHWEEPSPRFRMLLEQHFPAMASSRPGRSPEEDSFPASATVVDDFLRSLEPSTDPSRPYRSEVEVGELLLAQFHRAADPVEARLFDLESAGHSRLLELLGYLPVLLALEEPGAYGAAEEELARRARRWAADPRPDVAGLGALLAVATGDASRLPQLVVYAGEEPRLSKRLGSALVALFQRRPPATEPELPAAVVRQLVGTRRVLGAFQDLAGSGQPDPLAAGVLMLAVPEIPCPDRSELQRILPLTEWRWQLVPTEALAALVESGFPHGPPCSTAEAGFLDAVWRRLEARPDLRRRLDEAFAAYLAAAPPHGEHGLPPPWLAVFDREPPGRLAELVPEPLLTAATSAPPRDPLAEEWVRAVGRAAAVRGAWPGLPAWLEAVLAKQPALVHALPPGAEGVLGEERFEELVLDGETSFSRESRDEAPKRGGG